LGWDTIALQIFGVSRKPHHDWIPLWYREDPLAEMLRQFWINFELALEDPMTLCMSVAYGVTVLVEDLPVYAAHRCNNQLCKFSLILLYLFDRVAIPQIVQFTPSRSSWKIFRPAR
jgi:hypothetical protein